MRPDARSRRGEASQAQGSEVAQRIAPGSPFDFAQLRDSLLRALRIASPKQTEPVHPDAFIRKADLEAMVPALAIQPLRL